MLPSQVGEGETGREQAGKGRREGRMTAEAEGARHRRKRKSWSRTGLGVPASSKGGS